MTAPHAVSGLPGGPDLSPAQTTFEWLARPFAFLDQCAARYGDTFTLHFGRFGTHVLVADPADVRQVFHGDRNVLFAGRGNALLEPILGPNSLLVMDGDRHLEHRSMLQGAFRSDRFDGYGRVIAAATLRWTADWQDGSVVRVQRIALEISKEVILRIVLGLDDHDLERFSRLVHELMMLVGTNATFEEGSDPRLTRRFRDLRSRLDAALQEWIDTRRERPEGSDFLATLLAARDDSGAPLTDEELRDQLVTMILAGHETTASSITWALLCLHEQDTGSPRAGLEAELTAHAEAPDERLSRLPYLQAVCLETLRLRPVVPVVSRQLQAPFELGTRVLPAGVFVTPCAYLAHRRSQSFADPQAFRPERFLEQRVSPYAYFPFGGGVHRCLGLSFALLEMQIVVGMLMRRFRFEAIEPVRPVRRAVTIVASGGGKLRVHRRVAA